MLHITGLGSDDVSVPLRNLHGDRQHLIRHPQATQLHIRRVLSNPHRTADAWRT